MSQLKESLITELRSLISELGADGGLISPSIYDTAQVLRYAPPATGVESALQWLVNQQQADGGWGRVSAPLTREVPTLAAVLALHQYRDIFPSKPAVEAGLTFLNNRAYTWLEPLPEDLPVGIELIFPRLLSEAKSLGLNLQQSRYQALIKLGQYRLKLLSQVDTSAGTPALHSWEAWGSLASPQLLDGSGGVGHNPAATAMWLATSKGQNGMINAQEKALTYLRNAEYATETGIPGVVPTAWPITRFEQSFILHTLLLAGILNHPQIEEEVEKQLTDLELGFTSKGIGVSDYFVADGDDTCAAAIVLYEQGFPVTEANIEPFRRNDRFVSYPYELQPSHSVTARGIHALNLMGKETTNANQFIIERQLNDGRWPGDKWNSSWTYNTLLAVSSLKNTINYNATVLSKAVAGLINHQKPSGGWGANGNPSQIETAYGVLALATVENFGDGKTTIDQSLKKASQYMKDNFQPNHYLNGETCWIAKEIYRPYRIDRVFELSALLLLEERFHEHQVAVQ